MGNIQGESGALFAPFPVNVINVSTLGKGDSK